MRENFDNAGVARKVATLLALPTADRAIELASLAGNFEGWMKDNFNLQAHQLAQLAAMPINFQNKLGRAIANYTMWGLAVQFQKDEKKDEDPEFKDLIIQGHEQWQDEARIALLTPLFIRIAYRYSRR